MAPTATTAPRARGLNARAAAFAGISLPKTLMGVALLSGALAGLAGLFEVAAVHGSANASLIAGYGSTGILGRDTTPIRNRN